MVARPPAGTIPDTPGSYQFKDAAGRVIYVGKASSLRQRLSNYFQNPRNLHARTAQMVAAAATVEWIEVRNEVEALMLEYSLIKQHRPRFNIRLRDDKSYPVPRGHARRAVPTGAGDARPQAQGHPLLRPVRARLRDPRDARPAPAQLPVRTCSPGKFNEHQRLGRPCLLFHIEKCSGPCVGEIEEMPYRELVTELCDFLDGDTDEIVRRLGVEMREAASILEYERAARLRDRLTSVQRAIEKQQMVAERNEDIDVIGIADDDLEAAVQVFFVRRGRVVGRKGFILDKVEDLTPNGLVDRILENLYGDEPPTGVPEAGARPGRVRGPRHVRGVALPPAWLAGPDPGAAAGRQAGAPRDRHEERA